MYSLSDAQKPAIGGVRSLLVAGFSPDVLYTYATAERHTITTFSGVVGGWQRIDTTNEAQASAPGRNTRNGWQSAQKIDLSAAGLDVSRRAVIEALAAAPALLALVEDYAGQWWLYGQALGLKLPGYGLTTGQFRAETATTFSLERIEPAAPRRVATSFINLLYNSSTVFSEAPTV